jgi:hypothetical protein
MANTAADPWECLSDDERTTIYQAEEALVTERLSFEPWVAIGQDFPSLQTAVIRLAHTNRPIGKAYNEAYKRIEQPFSEMQRIDPGTRTDAIWLYENAERVVVWCQRDGWNNPRALRRHFDRMTQAASAKEWVPASDKNAIIAAQEEELDRLRKVAGGGGDQLNWSATR